MNEKRGLEEAIVLTKKVRRRLQRLMKGKGRPKDVNYARRDVKYLVKREEGNGHGLV